MYTRPDIHFHSLAHTLCTHSHTCHTFFFFSLSLSHTQPHAEAFGAACNIDSAYILNFGEEVVRGQPVFVLSGLLQDLEKALRSAAGAGPWQVGVEFSPDTL